jgi:hypothetical protein
MRYLTGIFLMLVSLGLVVGGQNAPPPKSEEANTQPQPTQDISSEDRMGATCDYEPNTVACAYKTAIERCGRNILDPNPETSDVEHNDDVVAKYNECVEPYRRRMQGPTGNSAPSGR